MSAAFFATFLSIIANMYCIKQNMKKLRCNVYRYHSCDRKKMQGRSKLPPPEWNMARIEKTQGMKKTETTILTNIAIRDMTDLFHL
jgi:hypothetical protein